jgi:hypothetical protein
MIDNSDLQQLTIAKRTIEEVFQLETQLMEPSDFINISTLICILPKGPVMLERNMNLTFLPFAENDTEEIKLLQFFSILPGTTMDVVDEKLKDALLHINHRTALGNFSINNGSEIAIRYVYPISKNNGISPSQFAEVLSLFLITLDLFSVKLRDFANGSMSLDDILNDI